MKRIVSILVGISMSCSALAQADTTAPKAPKESDTIRIGSMIIVKTRSNEEQSARESVRVYRRTQSKSALSTNWFIFDIGLTNFNDQTNYSSTDAQAFATGADKDWFKLKAIKSTNVNIWFFMQRLNVIKHVVNLKYGLGLEMNNYRFKEPVKFETDPYVHVILDEDKHYKKNKLAADYITIPMMLNFNFTPNKSKGFGLSVGASAGYLYSSRQKTITDEDGKNKKKDDFNLNPWKLSYIAELGLGPVKLYGSYATKSIFENGLDMTPYNVGIRLSTW